MYGFSRCNSEPDAGAYYHELFMRNRKSLSRYMRRVGAPHGPDRRKCKLAEGEDPDFYSMKSLGKIETEDTKVGPEPRKEDKE